MLLLDFLFIVFVFYLVTQILLPKIFPQNFETNWLFKKNKPIENKVDNLIDEKEKLSNEIDDILKEADEKLKETEKLKNKLN